MEWIIWTSFNHLNLESMNATSKQDLKCAYQMSCMAVVRKFSKFDSREVIWRGVSIDLKDLFRHQDFPWTLRHLHLIWVKMWQQIVRDVTTKCKMNLKTPTHGPKQITAKHRSTQQLSNVCRRTAWNRCLARFPLEFDLIFWFLLLFFLLLFLFFYSFFLFDFSLLFFFYFPIANTIQRKS